jgi:hypothetical protein
MSLSILRAGRAPLAFLATAFVTFTLAACADDQLATAPRAHPNATAVAGRDIPAPPPDSTLVTFSPEREVGIDSNGTVGIQGTFACSRDLGESYTMVMTLRQHQPDGVLESSAQYGRTCPSEANPFILYIGSIAEGRSFKRGKAVVTFEVIGGSPSVIHSIESRSVRVVDMK